MLHETPSPSLCPQKDDIAPASTYPFFRPARDATSALYWRYGFTRAQTPHGTCLANRDREARVPPRRSVAGGIGHSLHRGRAVIAYRSYRSISRVQGTPHRLSIIFEVG